MHDYACECKPRWHALLGNLHKDMKMVTRLIMKGLVPDNTDQHSLMR